MYPKMLKMTLFSLYELNNDKKITSKTYCFAKIMTTSKNEPRGQILLSNMIKVGPNFLLSVLVKLGIVLVAK